MLFYAGLMEEGWNRGPDYLAKNLQGRTHAFELLLTTRLDSIQDVILYASSNNASIAGFLRNQLPFLHFDGEKEALVGMLNKLQKEELAKTKAGHKLESERVETGAMAREQMFQEQRL